MAQVFPDDPRGSAGGRGNSPSRPKFEFCPPGFGQLNFVPYNPGEDGKTLSQKKGLDKTND